MSKAIKRAIAKRKEENTRRRFEEDSKYIIGNFNLIASTLEHSSNVADKDKSDDDDASSVSSFSTTATTDDNPGAGWTVDKYFYQPAGRRIEKRHSELQCRTCQRAESFSTSRSIYLRESSTLIPLRLKESIPL